ncbi:heme-binding protein [Streptomyces sp. 4503]|uniref:Heme-binding protein n=1 Tax=Streptomyces niphimycinicus TaxID=2842201 RepID=A0ABS6CH02_9ACTN|nr:heme-binding protein [Streptomyces niphimycinicus]MBU3866173.1 heme-binding protein [Streptomyces niphimycinicus]
MSTTVTAVAPLTTQDAEALLEAARAAAEAAGGGVPVHRDGRVIGAIGVGGGAPEQDHKIATTALATLG